jgi:hypothetical protein
VACFSSLVLSTATALSWYGESLNTVAGTDLLPMGSGRFASEGWQKAAFMRQLRYYWSLTSSWWYQSGEGEPYANTPECFTLDGPHFNGGTEWQNGFYFGGPGTADPGCF